jgi:hypothetical protein
MVFGPIVKSLDVESVADEVTLTYMLLYGLVVASPTVTVLLASVSKVASVAYPNASPIRLKFVLVDVPQEPASAPVAISLILKLLLYVAIPYYDTLIIEFEAPDDGKFTVKFPAVTEISSPKSITATDLI